jgi:aerobic C4-dicarboxylate transport protein
MRSAATPPAMAMPFATRVDRFMSEARALTNMIGNGVATVVIARWEGELDEVKMRRWLHRT